MNKIKSNWTFVNQNKTEFENFYVILYPTLHNAIFNLTETIQNLWRVEILLVQYIVNSGDDNKAKKLQACFKKYCIYNKSDLSKTFKQ